MANTQYQSIIRLFLHSGIDIDAPLNVSRIKKQFNAEFDMSSTGYIDAEGFSYTKSEVFEELERPDFETRYRYHRSIWDDKSVLDLLEQNAFNYYDFDTQMRKYANDDSFDPFFSSYFAVSFAYLSRVFVNEGRFSELYNLLTFEEFIGEADREEAFRSLRVFLDDSIKTFRNVSTESYANFKDEMRVWGHSGWSNVLNILPVELEDRKGNICFHLVNVTVAIQKTHRSACKFISKELINVNGLSYDLEKIIKGNHKVYTASKGTGGYGWIIWVVIILIKALSGC